MFFEFFYFYKKKASPGIQKFGYFYYVIIILCHFMKL